MARIDEMGLYPYCSCVKSPFSQAPLVVVGIAVNKELQYKSLEWIAKMSGDEDCLESVANHDPDVIPHTIRL